MNTLEKKMLSQLIELREKYGLIGIKTEFEAEGAQMEDIIRLRNLTLRAGVNIVLKVGGCEAVTDIRNGRILGVDEIVVPVTESPFAVDKFIGATQFVYPEDERADLKLLINVETIDGVRNFDQILALPSFASSIHGLDIGRYDLAASYGIPDGASGNQVFNICTELCQKLKRAFPHKPCLLGGPMNLETVRFLEQFNSGLFDGFEAKKVIFGTQVIREKRLKEALLKGIEFEQLWFENRDRYYRQLADESRPVITRYMAAHETILKDFKGNLS